MRNRKGTILVTTLWILALLTLLALGIGIRMGVDIKLIGFALNSSKAHYLAEAGLRKAIAMLEEDKNKYDSLDEMWSTGFDPDTEEYVLKDIALGEGSFTVEITDEENKMNINEVDDNMLTKLPDITSDIAYAILDWRDEDNSERTEGTESRYYEEELENPYECKNAPFRVPEELLLVKGITEKIYDGVKDIITVYGDSKAVNINTAPETVLEVLIGGEYEELPGKIMEYRNGDDIKPGTEDDNIFKDAAAITLISGLTQAERDRLNYLLKEEKCFKISSNAFRIISRGEVKDGRVRKTIEVVYKKDEKESPILYYYED